LYVQQFLDSAGPRQPGTRETSSDVLLFYAFGQQQDFVDGNSGAFRHKVRIRTTSQQIDGYGFRGFLHAFLYAFLESYLSEFLQMQYLILQSAALCGTMAKNPRLLYLFNMGNYNRTVVIFVAYRRFC
jgi:hypothetical protein